jgi:exonuclease III
MKIVTWNCNGAFRKKYHLLKTFSADILVIQECEDPAKAGGEYENWAQNYFWAGQNKNKGIGIFAQTELDLKRLDWDDGKLQQFLPCQINNQFNLIAVWTKQANSPNFRYIGQFWKYLQLIKNELIDTPSVICGDFNSNSCWDEWDRWWNHSDVVRELAEINIHSLFHNFMKETQGKESSPTFYMHRKISKPYHIDYAFASGRFLAKSNEIEIGKHEDWLAHSDHMPLIFTISEIC